MNLSPRRGFSYYETHTPNMIFRSAQSLLIVAGASIALAAAEPENFERLTFHSAPKALSAEATTEDWPRFLGPRHDLHSKESRLLKVFPKQGLAKVWEVKRGSGHAPTVISGRRLVMFHVLDGKEVIECLHTETGRRHWKYEYPVRLGSSYGVEDAPRSGPVSYTHLTLPTKA